ncbi:MAG: OmpA domain-containing protein [Parcubacteria group bacterium GW2011_GWE2_39_37]|nr:MAG: OmpA domain-containing protein [Parcubacteria group bacterium GW2011_GWE2_39_37]
MVFVGVTSVSATESAWQNLNPTFENGLTGTANNCSPLTVSNGTVAAFPTCTITCNSGYSLSGSTCVVIASNSGGGGGGGTTYCTTVTYSEWGVCSNNLQTRTVLTKSPSNCTMTSDQQIAVQKACQPAIPATPATPATSTTPSTPAVPATPATPAVPAASQFIFTKKLEYGMKNDDVLQLQLRMEAEKLLTATPNGYFGNGTLQAVKDFQKKNNLNVTGVVDAATMEKLNTTIPPNAGMASIAVINDALYLKLKGRIILKVEAKGEAYYINPSDKRMYSLGRPDDAFKVMREKGIGITNANLNKIQIGLSDLSGADTDGDGLSDLLETAIGTDLNKADTDGDGFGDKEELINGFNPKGTGNISTQIIPSYAGKIFLQVEGKGEAWYVNPVDNKRYFLGRPADAFNVMRKLGLGIANKDFDRMK